MDTNTKPHSNNQNRRKVIAYADDGTMFFNSAREASEYTRVDISKIYSSISRGTVYDGWSFNWYNE